MLLHKELLFYALTLLVALYSGATWGGVETNQIERGEQVLELADNAFERADFDASMKAVFGKPARSF